MLSAAMGEKQQLGAAAAVQLGGSGAVQQGGAVAALQLVGTGAEQRGVAVVEQPGGEEEVGAEQQQGGEAEVGAEQQPPRGRWEKEESKALVQITRDMMKHLRLTRLEPKSWHEVAGRLADTKKSQSWSGGPTPRRTGDECRIKYNSMVAYLRRRSQRMMRSTTYEFAEVGDPIDTVAGDEELPDAAAADGEALQVPAAAAEAVGPVLPVAGGPSSAPPERGGPSSPAPWSSTETNLLIILFPEAARESIGRKPWKLLAAKLSRVSAVNRTAKDCKRRIKKLEKHMRQQTEKDSQFFAAVEAMEIIVRNRSFDLNR